MATSTPPNAAPDATPPSRSPVGPAQLIADPYGAYGRLREAGPVHRVTGTDGRPAWVVTRYEDVRQALGDPLRPWTSATPCPATTPGSPCPPPSTPTC